MLTSIIACLAVNLYFEARNEPVVGQIAVTQVVLNRTQDPRYPDDPCDVITQGPHVNGVPVKNKCQFSWYCDGKKDVIWANYERTGQEIKLNAQAWRQSVEVAIWTLGYGSYRINDNTTGALYYYAHNLVYPHWADKFEVTEIIGNHTFMRPNDQ